VPSQPTSGRERFPRGDPIDVSLGVRCWLNGREAFRCRTIIAERVTARVAKPELVSAAMRRTEDRGLDGKESL
jgi:hypothetical protein